MAPEVLAVDEACGLVLCVLLALELEDEASEFVVLTDVKDVLECCCEGDVDGDDFAASEEPVALVVLPALADQMCNSRHAWRRH